MLATKSWDSEITFPADGCHDGGFGGRCGVAEFEVVDCEDVCGEDEVGRTGVDGVDGVAVDGVEFGLDVDVG